MTKKLFLGLILILLISIESFTQSKKNDLIRDELIQSGFQVVKDQKLFIIGKKRNYSLNQRHHTTHKGTDFIPILNPKFFEDKIMENGASYFFENIDNEIDLVLRPLLTSIGVICVSS
jgi:hypothetical protein